MKSIIRKLSSYLLVVAIAVSLVPASAFASSGSVTMTAYNEVIKTGNTIYCSGATGLYKVKLKNGKVTSKKKLLRFEGCYGYAASMKKKGKYIYFMEGSNSGIDGYISRVNINSGKKKQLAYIGLEEDYDYVIKGNKIYYYSFFSNRTKHVMDLNGKNKKKSSKKPILISKKTNAKGYRVKTVCGENYNKDYLKTPKGTFYLGKESIVG